MFRLKRRRELISLKDALFYGPFIRQQGAWQPGLFPFRKRSLPFVKVNATISNQAFSHDGCNIYTLD